MPAPIDYAVGHTRSHIPGNTWNVNDNKDADWIEGTEVGKYDHAKQTFVQQGDIVAAVGPVRQLCLGSGVLQLQVTTTRVKKSG